MVNRKPLMSPLYQAHGRYCLGSRLYPSNKRTSSTKIHAESFLRWPKSITAISTCSRQFQLVHGYFNLLTAISTFPRNFNFLTATLTTFFASLTTCQLQPLTVALHQKSQRKIKSRYFKSFFKEKSENQKLKVDSRTLMPVDSEWTTEEFTGPRKL